MSKHTPGPWEIASITKYPQNNGKKTIIIAKTGIVAQAFAPTLEVAENNAQRIVKCVNNFDDLLEACKEFIDDDVHSQYCNAIKGPGHETWIDEEDCDCGFKKIKQAIAKAEGEV